MATIFGKVDKSVYRRYGKATVLLLNATGDTVIASTISDQGDGTYSFTGLTLGAEYYAVVLGDGRFRSRTFGPITAVA